MKVIPSRFDCAVPFVRIFAIQLTLVTSVAWHVPDARAELHSGFALIPAGPAWDFSDSVAVAPPNGDLLWITLLANKGKPNAARGASAFPYYFLTNPPALIAYAPQDSTYESLTTAPEDTMLYTQSAEILSYGVYVIRTKENHFAKLRLEMVGGGGMTIEYTYQDDGTRILVEPVGVEPTTWGRVKSLYR